MRTQQVGVNPCADDFIKITQGTKHKEAEHKETRLKTRQE